MAASSSLSLRTAILASGFVATLAVLPAAHAATVTFSSGAFSVTQGEPTPNETQIFFNAATNTTSATGNVGSQTGTPIFTFTSSTDSFDVANGFATGGLTATAGLLNQLTIKAPTGFLFNDLIFRAQGPAGTAPTDLTFAASLGGSAVGGPVTISSIGEGAQAFLTAIALGSLMDTLTLTSTSGIFQFKQFEVSGLTAVPLPGAAWLFGSALVGLGFLGRRRHVQRGINDARVSKREVLIRRGAQWFRYGAPKRVS
jgi:hypothetical protein